MQRLPTLLVTVACVPSWACIAPPDHFNRGHASLVKEAKGIVIAQARAYKNEAQKCELVVTQVLKGNASEHLPLTCHIAKSGDWVTSFHGHTEQSFWNSATGRRGVESDCTLQSPTYQVGKSYVILLGIEPDTKQLEEISGPNDKWLLFIRERLARTKK